MAYAATRQEGTPLLAATALALSSALLHATWNVLVKRSTDRLISMWAQFALGGLPFVPVLAVVGLPPPAAYPYIIASAVLQGAYAVSLGRAYATGDLSVAYPLARGTAPVLATVGGALLLHDHLPAGGYAGVLLTSAGLTWIAVRGSSARGLRWALLASLLISGYTLSDTAGVRSGGGLLSYTAALFVASGVVLTGVVVLRRRPAQLVAALRLEPMTHVANAACAGVAYALVLAALRLAPVGYVAALREVSVIFAVLAGWLILREPFGPTRTAAAFTAVGGVAVLMLTAAG